MIAEKLYYFRGSPQLVAGVKGVVVQVAAGSNHTVLLTTAGQVYTFGSYKVTTLNSKLVVYLSMTHNGGLFLT